MVYSTVSSAGIPARVLLQ